MAKDAKNPVTGKEEIQTANATETVKEIRRGRIIIDFALCEHSEGEDMQLKNHRSMKIEGGLTSYEVLGLLTATLESYAKDK